MLDIGGGLGELDGLWWDVYDRNSNRWGVWSYDCGVTSWSAG